MKNKKGAKTNELISNSYIPNRSINSFECPDQYDHSNNGIGNPFQHHPFNSNNGIGNPKNDSSNVRIFNNLNNEQKISINDGQNTNNTYCDYLNTHFSNLSDLDDHNADNLNNQLPNFREFADQENDDLSKSGCIRFYTRRSKKELFNFRHKLCLALTSKKTLLKKKIKQINNQIFHKYLNFPLMTRRESRNILLYYDSHFDDLDIMIKCLIEKRKEIVETILYDVDKLRPDSDFEQKENNLIKLNINYDELTDLPLYFPMYSIQLNNDQFK